MLLKQPAVAGAGGGLLSPAHVDAPMTTKELDLSVASTGLIAAAAAPSPEREGMRLSRSAASFLGTLSPILPHPHKTVANAASPETPAQVAPSLVEGADGMASPDMPAPSAATLAMLAGADAAKPVPLPTTASKLSFEDSDEEEEAVAGGGDFDLSLFPATFRSGKAAEQLIEVWSLFAAEDAGAFFGESAGGDDSALSLEAVTSGIGIGEGKAKLLLGLLTSRGLLRTFEWQGSDMWRRR